MKRVLLIMAGFAVAATHAFALTTGWTTVDAGPYGIQATSVTQIDWMDEFFYGDQAYVEAEIDKNYSVLAANDGHDYGNGYAETTVSYWNTLTPGTYITMGFHYCLCNYAYGDSSYAGYELGGTDVSTYTVDGSSGNDPTPSITSITPNIWDAGQTYSVGISGTGFGTNPQLSMTGTGISYSQTSGSDTYISASITVDPNVPDGSVLVQVTSTGYNGMGFQGPQGGGGPTSPANTAQVRGAQGPIQLSCPSQVTRGTAAICTLSGVNAGSVTGWQFSGTDGVTVSGPGGALSWGGTMVQSGAVRATVTGGAMVEVGVSVVSRSWSTQPASPQQVANGSLSVTLPVPPTGLLGWSETQISTNASSVTVGSGPNAGYTYYGSADHPASTFWY